MLTFGVTIPATVPQRSEIPDGLTNYPVFSSHNLPNVLRKKFRETYLNIREILSCDHCPLNITTQNEHEATILRKRKTNWIGHILRRNCLLQQVIEGKIKGQIEVTRRQWRRRKKLLDDLKDRRGYSQLKEEALERTMWRKCFGRGFGSVVWQITDDDDDDI